jgi:hypothetical protein
LGFALARGISAEGVAAAGRRCGGAALRGDCPAGGTFHHVHDTPFISTVRAFFFLFLEKEKDLCGGTEAKKKKSGALSLRGVAGDYASRLRTGVSVSRVKPLPEFKIAKLPFVNIEFFIYTNKPQGLFARLWRVSFFFWNGFGCFCA